LHLKLFPSKACVLRFAPIMRTALLIAVASLLCTCARQPSLLEEVKTLGELRVVTRNSPITYYIGPDRPRRPGLRAGPQLCRAAGRETQAD
jgi:hypothetical protein